MATVIISILLLIALGAIIRSMLKKKSVGGCGCGCSECSMSDSCHGGKKE